MADYYDDCSLCVAFVPVGAFCDETIDDVRRARLQGIVLPEKTAKRERETKGGA